MELFEKVQVLKKKADISYEEARDLLEATNGDLVEAMVQLERRGRVNSHDKAEESDTREAKSFGRSLGRMISALLRFIRRTSFNVTRREKVIFTMPSFVFALLLFFLWEPIAPIMLIALFFGVRYSFSGGEDTEKANRVLNRAGDFADDLKSEFAAPAEAAAEKPAEQSAESAGDVQLQF